MRNGGRCFSGVLLLMEDTKREQYLRLLRSHPGSEEWTQKHMCLFLSSVDTWAAERGGTSSCPLSPCPCLYQNKTTSSFPGHPVIKVVHVLCRKRWEIQTGIKKKGKDQPFLDRKSTRLNSSHANISYAVFCLKNKNSCHAALS